MRGLTQIPYEDMRSEPNQEIYNAVRPTNKAWTISLSVVSDSFTHPTKYLRLTQTPEIRFINSEIVLSSVPVYSTLIQCLFFIITYIGSQQVGVDVVRTVIVIVIT